MEHIEAQVIHDMRNAVAVIRGAALQMIEEPLPAPVVARLAEMISRRGDLLGHLLDDLATADGLDRGNLRIGLTRVDLADVCHDALAQRTLPAHVRVTLDVDPDAIAVSDPTRLVQVLDNLVTNAVRYGGPQITISARRTGSSVRLQVIDDGAGVAPALRATLFDSYARGRASGAVGGSGLGLSIVWKLCQSLGGSVDYAAEPTSTFTVTLPAVPTSESLPTSDPAERGHAVAFWHDRDTIIDLVSGYATTGLVRGEAVLLVTTPDHRTAVTARLAADGVDVGSVLASGQLLFVDAHQMHEALVRDGRVDPDLFAELIGGTVDDVRERWQRLRAFGEIVDLYWRRGDQHLALELEHCWNQLRRRVDFPLLCGYEVGDDEAVGDVSDCHNAVVAA